MIFFRNFRTRSQLHLSSLMNFANDFLSMAWEVRITSQQGWIQGFYKKRCFSNEKSFFESTYSYSITLDPYMIFDQNNEQINYNSLMNFSAILSLYLAEKLRYSDNDSVVIYHVFIMFVYFFPIFGAMIADSWLGRFKWVEFDNFV